MKKIVEKLEIWDKEEQTAKSKEEAKKLVSQKFHKWIYIFGKNASKRMLTKKVWDYIIEIKGKFVLRKKKVYSLSREKKREVWEFIKE